MRKSVTVIRGNGIQETLLGVRTTVTPLDGAGLSKTIQCLTWSSSFSNNSLSWSRGLLASLKLGLLDRQPFQKSPQTPKTATLIWFPC